MKHLYLFLINLIVVCGVQTYAQTLRIVTNENDYYIDTLRYRVQNKTNLLVKIYEVNNELEFEETLNMANWGKDDCILFYWRTAKKLDIPIKNKQEMHQNLIALNCHAVTSIFDIYNSEQPHNSGNNGNSGSSGNSDMGLKSLTSSEPCNNAYSKLFSNPDESCLTRIYREHDNLFAIHALIQAIELIDAGKWGCDKIAWTIAISLMKSNLQSVYGEKIYYFDFKYQHELTKELTSEPIILPSKEIKQTTVD